MDTKTRWKLALVAAFLLAASFFAGASGSTKPIALALGWYGDDACDDALAQNPGAPEGCRYDARERDCDNGVDDDSDEAADGADSDCGACSPSNETCGDGEDQDCDGYVDCADPDCAFAPWLPSTWGCSEPEICGNGLDDDGDGLGDWPWVGSQDPDCFEICDDGIDNDLDSYADCSDARCVEAPACLEDCGNGVDDADADDQVDCDDTECAPLGGCTGTCTGSMYCDRSCPERDPSRCPVPENQPDQCADGIDNDLDGIVDCSDPDCDTWCLICRDEMAANAGGLGNCSPTRLDQRCADGADNDRDLRADCLDPDCDSAEGCARCDGTKVCDAGCPEYSLASCSGCDGTKVCDARCPEHDPYNSECLCDGSQLCNPVCPEYDACACDPADPACDFTCDWSLTENCTNGWDDDCDEEVDCWDDDCKESIYCKEDCDSRGGNLCFDGADNDGDYRVDCADNSCSMCPNVPAEEKGQFFMKLLTTDGFPAHEDYRIVGGPYEYCSEGLDPNSPPGLNTVYEWEPRFGACADGQDNDSDLFIDCADVLDCCEYSVCEFDPACGPLEEHEENCLDGIDDDNDGFIDCDDGDCAGNYFCPDQAN